MMQKFLIFLLFSFAFQTGLYPQTGIKEVKPETKAEKKQAKRLYNVSQFLHESYLFVRQPTLWDGSDWIKAGIIAASTLAVMPLDKPIMNATQGKQRYYYSVPVVGGRVYGEWYSIGGVAGAFALYGMLARDTASKKISIELLQAGVYSQAVTGVLKIAIGRARPYSDKGAFTFRPFSVFDDRFHSMPSGHTTSAMALSTVMSRHAHSTALKILAYVPAGFTMFSRIYQNKHWWSDEFIAAGLGYFVGNWVVDLHEGRRHRINVTSVYPVTSFTVSLDRIPKKINRQVPR